VLLYRCKLLRRCGARGHNRRRKKYRRSKKLRRAKSKKLRKNYRNMSEKMKQLAKISKTSPLFFKVVGQSLSRAASPSLGRAGRR
jgi:hypothetical protein